MTSNQQFGLVVAYLLPGFICRGGLALLVPTVAQWLRPVAGQDGLGLGPPVYAVLAATATGMVVSCFRWFLVDHALHWTGVIPPDWDAGRLEERLGAFNRLVEYHYRYYQFYANTFLAVLFTYGLNRWMVTSPLLGLTTDVGVLLLCCVLLAGSRDALLKYYHRTDQLIGRTADNHFTGNLMTNGCHRDQSPGSATPDKAESKPVAKPVTQKPEPRKSKGPKVSK